MKVTSLLALSLVVLALGCSQHRSTAGEAAAASTPHTGGDMTKADTPDGEHTLSVLALSIPGSRPEGEASSSDPDPDMPAFLKERLLDEPYSITVTEVRGLDDETRKAVLAYLEQVALALHEAGKKYRAGTNPATRSRDRVQRFIDASR